MEDQGIPVYAYDDPHLYRSVNGDKHSDTVLDSVAGYICHTGDDELSVELTRRYFGVFYPELAEYANLLRLGHWQGYGQGDWLRYAYISEYDESSDFSLYLQGDISLVRIDLPNGDNDYIGGIYGRFGRVTGEDIGLDISGARIANRTVVYS